MEIEGSISSEQQREKCLKQWRASKEIFYENKMMNLIRYGRATLRLVTQEKKRLLNTIPENSAIVFDITCHDYEWLRSGCITEEQFKPNNRLYQYYYDRLEKMYNTRVTVDSMGADIEKDRQLIVLDE